MMCPKCNKENENESQYCRFCGTSLIKSKNTLFQIPKNFWKTPVFLVFVSVAVIGMVAWSGTRAYADYEVGNKISIAKTLQENGNYSGSLLALEGAAKYTATSNQAAEILSLKSEDTEFIKFQSSYDEAVANENSTTTANLQLAQTDLESIGKDYPQYKNVQAALIKVQDSLVTALQNQAIANGESALTAKAQAEKAIQAANSAHAAQVAAEEAAASQAAETPAVTPVVVQQPTAPAPTPVPPVETAAETQESQDEQTLLGQITTDYNYYEDNSVSDYATCIADYNEALSNVNITFSGALTYCNDVITDDNYVYQNLGGDFSDVPESYKDAKSALNLASQTETASARYILNDISNGTDSSEENNANQKLEQSYISGVKAFLANPQ